MGRFQLGIKKTQCGQPSSLRYLSSQGVLLCVGNYGPTSRHCSLCGALPSGAGIGFTSLASPIPLSPFPLSVPWLPPYEQTKPLVVQNSNVHVPMCSPSKCTAFSYNTIHCYFVYWCERCLEIWCCSCCILIKHRWLWASGRGKFTTQACGLGAT